VCGGGNVRNYYEMRGRRKRGCGGGNHFKAHFKKLLKKHKNKDS
jgi:hypothetical protein